MRYARKIVVWIYIIRLIRGSACTLGKQSNGQAQVSFGAATRASSTQIDPVTLVFTG